MTRARSSILADGRQLSTLVTPKRATTLPNKASILLCPPTTNIVANDQQTIDGLFVDIKIAARRIVQQVCIADSHPIRQCSRVRARLSAAAARGNHTQSQKNITSTKQSVLKKLIVSSNVSF